MGVAAAIAAGCVVDVDLSRDLPLIPSRYAEKLFAVPMAIGDFGDLRCRGALRCMTALGMILLAFLFMRVLAFAFQREANITIAVPEESQLGTIGVECDKVLKNSQFARAMGVTACIAGGRVVNIDIACYFPFLALPDTEECVSMSVTASSLTVGLTLHCRGGVLVLRSSDRFRSCERREGRKAKKAQRGHSSCSSRHVMKSDIEAGPENERRKENLVIDSERYRCETSVSHEYTLTFSSSRYQSSRPGFAQYDLLTSWPRLVCWRVYIIRP